jgi:ABC-2 type transport system permease protein
MWRQFRFERRLFWRNPSAAFFNFLLPLLFLVLIASAFNASSKDLETLVPGIAGMGIMATTFTALAFNLTYLREEGILKRIQGTPLPRLAYFGGLIGNSVTNALVQVTLVVVIGHFAYDVSWPADWLGLGVFTVLGVACFAALGIAFSQAIPNFDSAPAYTNAIFLPAIFISGVFYSVDNMPKVLLSIAEALPLKHVIDGLHEAIVTGDGLSSQGTALGIIGLWLAAGVYLAVRHFRWE